MFITVLVAGGFFIAKGQMTGEDLAIYALYINIFINPVNVLVEFTEQLQKGLAGFERFREVVETTPDIEDKENAGELKNVKGVIDYKDVSFSYEDDENVLNHIDLHVDAGKSVAIVGPSGGGKTTLCSLLPRFYDVTGGSVLIDGTDIRDVTQKSLRSYIGIVQQDVYLFNGTVKENIAYGKPEATMEEIVEAARRADLLDFIETLPNGFETQVGERGARLSGGQKQRIAIARVFLKNPPILILDEATSALDNESERYIQESLDKLSVGRTTITIAHRLSTILGADEILVLDGDGIKERGNHKELIKLGGLYEKYYRMQLGKV
jgi:ATP-binding cassette subfamily B protein